MPAAVEAGVTTTTLDTNPVVLSGGTGASESRLLLLPQSFFY
jgi:hypothetical protein